MKSFILAVAVLFSSAAFGADPQTVLNLNIQATDQVGNAVSSAQCKITQSLKGFDTTGTFVCSFNHGAEQTLKTVATFVSPATDSQLAKIDYDFFSGEDLGDYLFNGLNLKGAKDYVSLFVTLDKTPTTTFPFLMVGADDYSHYYYLNISLSYAN